MFSGGVEPCFVSKMGIHFSGFRLSSLVYIIYGFVGCLGDQRFQKQSCHFSIQQYLTAQSFMLPRASHTASRYFLFVCSGGNSNFVVVMEVAMVERVSAKTGGDGVEMKV